MWQESFQNILQRCLKPPRAVIYEASRFCIAWMLMDPPASSSRSLNRMAKNAENNQDRKISHHQLLSKELADSHIKSHRLNRNFPSKNEMPVEFLVSDIQYNIHITIS